MLCVISYASTYVYSRALELENGKVRIGNELMIIG